MAKSEVYAWRMSPDLKMALEDAARRQGLRVSVLLERVVRAWLEEHADVLRSEEEERIRARALRCAGVLESGDRKRSSQVSRRVRERLAARKARRGRT
jgi:macrodomain Ter protein organizer (MatP/YcbG family)